MRDIFRVIAIACLASIAVVFATLWEPSASKPVAQQPTQPQTVNSMVRVNVPNGHGSGVHIGHGFIVTAAHVVTDLKEVEVIDRAGKTHKGVVLWANTVYDVALVRVENADGIGASPLSCSVPVIGQEVAAAGNPGPLEFSYVWGRVASEPGQRAFWRVSVVVSIAVAGGMSGGPVYDTQGHVVGIVVGGLSGSSFAVIVPGATVCMVMGAA